MTISDYMEDKLLDKSLRNVDFTAPTLFISLHTAAPGDTGANEAVGIGYVRKGSVTFGVTTDGVSNSTTELFWTSLPALTITHIGVWDALSGGNHLWNGPLVDPVTVQAGGRLRIVAGNLTAILSGGLSDYLETKGIDKVFRAVNFTTSAWFISLHTGDPGETGLNEVTGGSYARQALTFTTPVSGTTDNTGVVTFSGLLAVTVTHAGVYDAASGGNFLWGGPLAAPVVVNAGGGVTFPVGDFNVVLD